MMVLTAKLNLKKIVLSLGGIAALALSLILLLGGDGQEARASVTGNDARVQFLRDLGWEVVPAPHEAGQVLIPDQTSQVYERYNALQKSQGYDLTEYAGKKVMRYVYRIENFPGAAGPVYATVLVHQDRIIGGDITDAGPGGRIRSLQPARTPAKEETVPSSSAQTEPSAGEETRQ